MASMDAPSDGERNAVIGFRGQFHLAAKLVLAQVPRLEWIRVADPTAGIGDDFQFKSGSTHHAIQVKWSEFGPSFTWGDLTSAPKDKKPLIKGLADAWRQITASTADQVLIHLCSSSKPSDTRPPATDKRSQVAHLPKNHFAGFLARSLEPLAEKIRNGAVSTIDDLHSAPEFVDWFPWWESFIDAAGVLEDESLLFLAGLRFHFGLATSNSLDSDLLSRVPIEADESRLADEFEAIVADPSGKTEFTKAELFARLGWQTRVTFQNRHDFPIAEAYVRNAKASTELASAIERVEGGYLALVAPAGAGKSSLLADLQFGGWTMAKYYAFLPDAVDPLSARGEADVFLRDLSLLLEEAGIWRSGFGTELSHLRQILTAQLEQCGQRFEEHGTQTLIVIDGLDHVPREQSPVRSLIEELPSPNSIPRGVYVVLGTQTADILPLAIRHALAVPGRIVDVPRLTDDEVKQVAVAAGPGKWIGDLVEGELVAAAAGHPLPLSYLIEEIKQVDQHEDRIAVARSIIERADLLGGDLEARYAGYFETCSGFDDLVDILSIVSRMRLPVDIRWLSSWAAPAALKMFKTHAAVFFRKEGDVWTVIHNSFRLYIASRTSSVPGRPQNVVDAELHRRLADLYASSSAEWPLYIDEEIAHRLLGGENARVVDLGGPGILQPKLENLRPFSVVRAHAGHALEAAADLGDMHALVRQVLFLNDIEQRAMVIDHSDFADLVAAIDPLQFGLDHVLEGSRLLVDENVAAALAQRLSDLGQNAAAARVLHAIGGLSAFTKQGARSREDWRKTRQAITSWVSATSSARGVGEVLAEIDDGLGRSISTLEQRHRDAAQEFETSAPEAHDSEDDGVEPRWRWERRIRDMEDAVWIAKTIREIGLVAGHRHSVGLYDRPNINEFADRLDEFGSDQSCIVALINAAEISLRDGFRAEFDSVIDQAIDLAVGTCDADEEVAADSESEDVSDTRITLTLRIRIAELLLSSPDADREILDQLLPVDEVVDWPTSVASGSGIAEWRDWFAHRRICSMLGRAAGPIQTAASGDVARNRLHRALDALAHLEASERLVQAGLRLTIDWADTDHIWRLLELPKSPGVHPPNAWYQVVDAAPEILKRFTAVVSRNAAIADNSQLLARLLSAWTDPARSTFWGPRMRLAAIDGLARGASFQVARTQLLLCERFIESIETDPDSLSGWWRGVSRIWLTLGDSEAAKQAAQSALRSSLGPGVSDHDRQLVGWVSWLSIAVASVDDKVAQIEMLEKYARRVERVSAVDENIAEDAVDELIGLAWTVDPGVAVGLAMRMTDQGVIPEWSATRRILESALDDPLCSEVVASSAVRELIVPTATRPAGGLLKALRRRVTPAEVEQLTVAIKTWLLPSNARTWIDELDGDPELAETAEPRTSASVTPGSLLARLRTRPLPPDIDWSTLASSENLRSSTLAVAKELLTAAVEAQIPSHVVARIAGIVAVAGDADSARLAMTSALADSPAAGWFTYYDGGSRLKVWSEATRSGSDDLQRLAAADFAKSVSRGALRSAISPADLRPVIECLSPSRALAELWNEIDDALDRYAPTSTREETADIPNRCMTVSNDWFVLTWVRSLLGHPVRDIDFGARRTLMEARAQDAELVDDLLAETPMTEGWATEAWLHSYYLSTEISDVSSAMRDSLRDLTRGADALLRFMAIDICDRLQVAWTPAAARPLPAALQLELPPAPEHRYPELDAEGIPHIDYTDPRQTIAPYDLLVEGILTVSEVSPDGLLYRASALAVSMDEYWLRKGHREHAERLKRRGTKFTYRPWPLMVGRRAAGRLLAELHDAGETDANAIIESAGLIDEFLARVPPQPLDESIAPPWRAPDVEKYDFTSWCDDAPVAARVMAAGIGQAAEFVLGENSHWGAMDWAVPKERRRVISVRPRQTSTRVWTPPPTPRTIHETAASVYPRVSHRLSDRDALLVEGWDLMSDTPNGEWLALNPRTAIALGWTLSESIPFEWVGPDGAWRARSTFQVRGMFQNGPSEFDEDSARVWRVVLSAEGLAELTHQFGLPVRLLEIKRTMPAKRREGTPQLEEIASAPVL